MPAVAEAMNEPRIAVIGKDNRLADGKDPIEGFITESMRMLTCWLQAHEVHDVDNPDLQFREMFPQKRGRGQDFEGGNISGASQNYVRFLALIVTGPFPDADTGGAMANGSLHVEPLQFRLLAGHNHIDVVAAAQAMVGHREQGIRVGT